jgi:hypothetical protein
MAKYRRQFAHLCLAEKPRGSKATLVEELIEFAASVLYIFDYLFAHNIPNILTSALGNTVGNVIAGGILILAILALISCSVPQSLSAQKGCFELKFAVLTGQQYCHSTINIVALGGVSGAVKLIRLRGKKQSAAVASIRALTSGVTTP